MTNVDIKFIRLSFMINVYKKSYLKKTIIFHIHTSNTLIQYSDLFFVLLLTTKFVKAAQHTSQSYFYLFNGFVRIDADE